MVGLNVLFTIPPAYIENVQHNKMGNSRSVLYTLWQSTTEQQYKRQSGHDNHELYISSKRCYTIGMQAQAKPAIEKVITYNRSIVHVGIWFLSGKNLPQYNTKGENIHLYNKDQKSTRVVSKSLNPHMYP